jgi:hypothetical protein
MHAIKIYFKSGIVCLRLECASVKRIGGSIGNVTLPAAIKVAAFFPATALYNDGTTLFKSCSNCIMKLAINREIRLTE